MHPRFVFERGYINKGTQKLVNNPIYNANRKFKFLINTLTLSIYKTYGDVAPRCIFFYEILKPSVWWCLHCKYRKFKSNIEYNVGYMKNIRNYMYMFNPCTDRNSISMLVSFINAGTCGWDRNSRRELLDATVLCDMRSPYMLISSAWIVNLSSVAWCCGISFRDVICGIKGIWRNRVD